MDAILILGVDINASDIDVSVIGIRGFAMEATGSDSVSINRDFHRGDLGFAPESAAGFFLHLPTLGVQICLKKGVLLGIDSPPPRPRYC